MQWPPPWAQSLPRSRNPVALAHFQDRRTDSDARSRETRVQQEHDSGEAARHASGEREGGGAPASAESPPASPTAAAG
ncbi:hypothetical protein PAL_GLEAN10021452 [Pteropus alecto]|uniref:Uncharacterized protein n=1 Tax=Pteropus alecto TaxID=9402 RepID=L5KAQ2_PTEAL|nr:hypothetical protein PAL_GLEAN10021452 [Pteropus alecto]